MPRYKVAVFDLDGTLMDTSGGVISSVKYTIEKLGLPMPDDDGLRSFIGPPIPDSLKNRYDLEGEKLAQAVKLFRDRYSTVDLLKATPYDGIYELLSRLISAGVKPAVATYKREDYAQKLLKYYHFDDYMEILYGADPYNKLKKHDIILKAVVDSGVCQDDLNCSVMIGDSDNDAIGAERLGIDFVGVTYGFGFRSVDDVMQYPNVGCAQNTMQIGEIILCR